MQQPVAVHLLERKRGVEPGERVAQVAVQAVELTGVELAQVLVGDRAEPDRAREPPGERERIKRLRRDGRYLRLARRELQRPDDRDGRDEHEGTQQCDESLFHNAPPVRGNWDEEARAGVLVRQGSRATVAPPHQPALLVPQKRPLSVAKMP